MKKIATLLFAGTAAFALSACGSSDSADEKALEENVEMPAEEAVADIEATPVAPEASATGDAAEATATPSDGASAAVEAATADAEKKM